jgi:HlyD family secretion protein
MTSQDIFFVALHIRTLIRVCAKSPLFTLLALAAMCSLTGCAPSAPDRVQGYVEGEFVYVASPLSGTLESLHVRRGDQVKEGDVLFELDSAPEKAALDQAEHRVSQAAANLEDVRKGKRPSEIESLMEQMKQARAALMLSEKELARREHLFAAKAISAEALDVARSSNDQNRHRVSQLEADLATARLGSRSDQISAAEAAMRAQEAALAKAEWDLSQKRRSAARDSLVFDTLYREGEWVAAGRPVVALLPPQNIKVRAFVPETRIATIHIGDRVRVAVDGIGEPFTGKVSYISPRAEYTPPVIYSREARSKLVFMIEAVFDPKTAENLHPGQPVDVFFRTGD